MQVKGGFATLLNCRSGLARRIVSSIFAGKPPLKSRLFLRRLSITSPRLAVRSALPWPLSWGAGALVLGICATIALSTFEMGSNAAGVDAILREELTQSRQELSRLREERDHAQLVFNTSGSLLITEKAVQEKMLSRIKQLEDDNRVLRDNLAFFEKLLPAGSEAASIRSLHAEAVSDAQLKWQVLVIQPLRDPPAFNGKLDLTVSGLQNGKPWAATLPGGAQALQFKHYRRVEGLLELPPSTVVKTVTARITEGNAVRSVQTFRL